MSEVTVGIRLKADGSGLVGEVRVSKAELDKLTGSVDRTGRAAQKAGNDTDRLSNKQKKAQNTSRGLSNEFRFMRRALFAIGMGVLIRDTIRLNLEMEGLRAGLGFITGSASASAQQIDFVRRTADQLGLSFRDLLPLYTKLIASSRGTNLEGEKTEKLFIALAKAATVYQLSGEKVKAVFRAVEQIISKGNVSAEELRQQMGEALPGAFQLAARAVGKTTQELNKMLDRGEVLSDEFLPKLAAQLERELAGGVSAASQTARAELARLENAFTDLQLSFAQGDFLEGLAAGAVEFTDAVEQLVGSGGLEALGSGLGQSLSLVARNIDVMTELGIVYLSTRTAVALLTAAQVRGLIPSMRLLRDVTFATSLAMGGNFVGAQVLALEATTALRLGITRLWAVMAANPLVAIAIGVGALVTGYVLLRDRTEKLNIAEANREVALGRIRRLQDQLNTATGEAAAKLRELTRAEIERERQRLTAERSRLQTEIAGKQRNLQASLPGLGAQSASSTNLQAVSRLQRELKALRSELSTTESALSDLGGATAKLDSRMQEIPVSAREIREEFVKGLRAIVEFQEEFEELEFRLDPTAGRVREFKAEINLLAKALDLTIISKARFRELLSELIEELPTAAKFIDELRESVLLEAAALGLSAREREIELVQRRLLAVARRQHLKLGVDEIAQLRLIATAMVDVKNAAEKRKKAEEKAAREIVAIWENARENVQRSFADTIDDVLGGNLNSITDFWDSFTAIGRRAIAETLAASAFQSAAGGLPFPFSGFGPSAANDNLPLSGKALDPALNKSLNQLKASVDKLRETMKGDGEKAAPNPVEDAKAASKFKKLLGTAIEGAAIGSIASNLLGKGKLGAAIGGAIGGSIGQALGGTVGKKIGAAIGGFIGAAFGKTKTSGVKLTGGDSVSVSDAFRKGKGDLASASTLGDQTASFFNAIASITGGSFAGNLGTVGLRKKKFFFDQSGGLGNKRSRQLFATAEEAVLAALRSAVNTGKIGGLSDTFATILKNSIAGSPQEILQDLEFGKIFDDLVDTRQLTEAEKAINELNETFTAAASRARQLGLSEEKLTKARATRLAQMKDEFDLDQRLAILDFTNPLEAALERQRIEQEERLRTAAALGADLAQVERLNLLERSALIDEFRQDLGAASIALAREIDSFLDEIRFGSGSLLSPGDQLRAAEQRFADVTARAQGGDESALAEVVDAARSLRDASLEVFASSETFFQRDRFIQDTLEALKGQQQGLLDSNIQAAVDKVSPAVLTEEVLREIGNVIQDADENAQETGRAIIERLDRIAVNFNLQGDGAVGGTGGARVEFGRNRPAVVAEREVLR